MAFVFPQIGDAPCSPFLGSIAVELGQDPRVQIRSRAPTPPGDPSSSSRLACMSNHIQHIERSLKMQRHDGFWMHCVWWAWGGRHLYALRRRIPSTFLLPFSLIARQWRSWRVIHDSLAAAHLLNWNIRAAIRQGKSRRDKPMQRATAAGCMLSHPRVRDERSRISELSRQGAPRRICY
jgi:hypothetical protein